MGGQRFGDMSPIKSDILFDALPKMNGMDARGKGRRSYHWKAGLGSRSRLEPGVFGSLEPEPLEKKEPEQEPLGKEVRSRSGKKLAGSSALREDK